MRNALFAVLVTGAFGCSAPGLSPDQPSPAAIDQGTPAHAGGREPPPTAPATSPAPGVPFAFVFGFRISHYLEMAVGLQKLDPDVRAEALRAIALDRARSSEVFPLCRMLFEARENRSFRGPQIGRASFVERATTYDDWPLEPITIYEGVPILIVRGYQLTGFPEQPDRYVDYCLANLRWRGDKYAAQNTERLRETAARFIAAHPMPPYAATAIERQAE